MAKKGDTPHTDKEPALVDTSREPDIKAEGDSLKPGYVSRLESPEPPPVDPKNTGDTPRANFVGKVEEVDYGTRDDELTALELHQKRTQAKAVSAAPNNKAVTPATTASK
jgi:hypothetical protein